MFRPVVPEAKSSSVRPPGPAVTAGAAVALSARTLSAAPRLARAALFACVLYTLAGLGGAARCALAQTVLAQASPDNAPLRTQAAWREGIAKLGQYRLGNGPAPAPMRIGVSRAVSPVFRRPPLVSDPEWQGIIRRASRRHGLDAALLTAVIRVESNFNPYAVSGRGARGAMQIMPATGRELGLEDFFDPAANIEAGARYLAEMLRLFPSLELSLAAYNAGPGAVRQHGGRIPPYGETRRYVHQVLSEYRRLNPHRVK